MIDTWNPYIWGSTIEDDLADVISEMRRIRRRQKLAGIHDPECATITQANYPPIITQDRDCIVATQPDCDCWLTTEWKDNE